MEDYDKERQERVRSLISRLNAAYPEEPLESAQSRTASQTLLLDATPTKFARWLKAQTRGIGKQKYPANGGYFTLQPSYERVSEKNHAQGVTVLLISGLFYEKNGGFMMHYGLITFIVTDLNANGIAVQTKCSQEAIADYYVHLLESIKAHYTQR